MDKPSTAPGWSPTSWRSKPARQMPAYADQAALERTISQLSQLPPIVVSWEVEQLKQQLAEAQQGKRFLLQGGDCAESFSDCQSDQIAKKLKILLQMSLVLLHGLKKPVIRVGRFAGQYAKPRSADLETRDGLTLPSYRGDVINAPSFTQEAREPDPQLMLRGYERAALTLNFVRALVDGGFADLHHPEYWDLGFVQHSPLREAYQRLIEHAGTGSRVIALPVGLSINALRLLDWTRLSPLAPWHYLTYHKPFYFDVAPLLAMGWKPKYSNDEMFAESYDDFLANYDRRRAERAGSAHRRPVKELVLRVVKMFS